jgi:CBS domain-containing protein
MLTAADLMTKDVATIRSSATIAEAMKLMRERGWRSLIVDRIHEQDAYGIITETDIVYKVLAYGADPKQLRVYELMSKPCLVVNPELGVEHVARLFAAYKVSCAPVIQGSLLGIISVSDLLAKGQSLDTPYTEVVERHLQASIDRAYQTCEKHGITSKECLMAWRDIEELEAISAHQRGDYLDKTAFDVFCEEHPEILKNQDYETWCSG